MRLRRLLTDSPGSTMVLDQPGGVAERLNAPVLKTGWPARVTGVRIPSPPLKSATASSAAPRASPKPPSNQGRGVLLTPPAASSCPERSLFGFRSIASDHISRWSSILRGAVTNAGVNKPPPRSAPTAGYFTLADQRPLSRMNASPVRASASGEPACHLRMRSLPSTFSAHTCRCV